MFNSCVVSKKTNEWILRKKVLQLKKQTDKEIKRQTELNS